MSETNIFVADALDIRQIAGNVGNSFADPLPSVTTFTQAGGSPFRPAASQVAPVQPSQPVPAQQNQVSAPVTVAQQPQTPVEQATQNAPSESTPRAAAAPAFGPSRLSERTITLAANRTHAEMVTGASFKIVSSTAPDTTFRIRFDESETLTVAVGDTLSGGFSFRSFEITADQDTQIIVQTGYAFQG